MTGPQKPNRPVDDAFLEALFDDARAAGPDPSEGLLDRIAADAQNFQPASAAALPRAGLPLHARLREALGGWAGLGGLVTATIAGFYIGFAQPGTLGLILTTDNVVDVADVTSWTDSGFWPLDALSFEEG